MSTKLQTNPGPPDGWLPIAMAQKGTVVKLASYYVPSTVAASNGSRAHWTFGEGRELWEVYWSGILGGKPSHWFPLEEEPTA